MILTLSLQQDGHRKVSSLSLSAPFLSFSSEAPYQSSDLLRSSFFGAATALSPTAAQLENASGGVYNYVGALAVSASIVAVYLYQGVFAKK